MTLMAAEPVQRARVEVPPIRWWIAQVQPQAEERLVEELTKVGVYALCPKERVRKTYTDHRGRLQTKVWTRTMFEGYVFYSGSKTAPLEFDDRYLCQKTVRILNTFERDWREIGNFVLAYESGPVWRGQSMKLSEGLPVKIVSGSYMGVEGKVLRFGDTKVVLQMSVCGTAELTTELENIEPIWGD